MDPGQVPAEQFDIHADNQADLTSIARYAAVMDGMAFLSRCPCTPDERSLEPVLPTCPTLRRTLADMSDDGVGRVSVELSPDEARLVIAALRQFEPYWPSDLDDLTRADLLANIGGAIDHLTSSLNS